MPSFATGAPFGVDRTRRALTRISPATLVALVMAGTTAAPLVASAQEQAVKPYVMLLVDTSGSMIWPTCTSGYSIINGDNSSECPGSDLSCGTCNSFGCGNSTPDDTRLFKVKKGAFSVVSAFGEVTFGLSRFRNVPASFTCDAASNSRAGGWAGGSCAKSCTQASDCNAPYSCVTPPGFCLRPCNNNNDCGAGYTCNNGFGLCVQGSSFEAQPPDLGTSGNQADLLVSFSDTNQSEILSWMNNCSDYPSAGQCGAAPDTGCSLCPDCGTGCDKELRGVSATPIAGSLYDLRVNFFNSGVISGDTKSACRPYKVILLTDGLNTCGGDPVAQASALYNNAGKSIPVHVVGFGDASLKPGLDAIAAAGGTTEAIIVDNEVSLALAMAGIISESLLTEKCNNADDDCDGACDETFPEVAVTGASCTNKRSAQSCTVGLGICERTGVYQCKSDESGVECSVSPGPPNPGGEICGNGLDDDCDGQVDEGCVPCVPQPEICDGKDNDCDGDVDEDYTPVACGSNIGECKTGTTACVAGKVVCNGATPPATELCDAKDNNCDTVIDLFSEACYPPGNGNGCNTSSGVCQGVCQIGSRLCTNGAWGSCLNYVGPTNETCNGIDDDCDGQVDEGVVNTCTDYSTCTTFQTCATCPTKPAEVCDGKDNDCNGQIDDNALGVGDACGTAVGECKKGTFACENVSGTFQLVCKNATGPGTETCDAKDNDCNGVIDDNIAGLGGPCGSATGECSQGTLQCIGGQQTCVGEVGSQNEVCDGKDNDCDGTVDNNLPVIACGSDVGECKKGTLQCVAGKSVCNGATGPTAEVCDGKDNDCNGLIDDSPTDVGTACGSAVGECKQGVTKCFGGNKVCDGDVGPQTEVCDGKDNDCDGTADNGIATVGDTCGSNVGECKEGKIACENVPNSGWALICKGGVASTQEICDGKDNDCDGQIDEDFPEKNQNCGKNVGECKAGTWACESGSLVCKGGSLPSQELCDGKDNDCDGAIDNNPQGEGKACGSAVGECKEGITKCVGGKFVCQGETPPAQELCDGKDNDCDGKGDNAAACPGASECVEGQCVVPCSTGEFVCPGGTKCVNNYCIPDECAVVTCKDTERCIDGNCIEKCTGVECKDHEKCDPNIGLCVDNSCVTKGCPDGQVCSDFECKSDPCPPGKCAAGEQCTDGNCIGTCLNKNCPIACVQGECVDDPCEGFPCNSVQTCKVDNNGKATCVDDPCRLVRCAGGQICVDGDCKDNPCNSTTCPKGTRCELTYKGLANCKRDETTEIGTTSKVLATGSGGFVCDLSGAATDAPPLTVLLLLGLALLLSRSRRER